MTTTVNSYRSERPQSELVIRMKLDGLHNLAALYCESPGWEDLVPDEWYVVDDCMGFRLVNEIDDCVSCSLSDGLDNLRWVG